MASIYRINAMKEAHVGIAAVLLDSRRVVFGNGVKVKIKLLDGDGNEVKEPDDATHYEFGDEKFGFGKAKLFHDDEEEYQTEH